MHLGLIGFGAIGQSLARLSAGLETPLAGLTVLVRPNALARVEAAGLTATADLDSFLATRPDLIIECAGHSAVEAYVPTCLSAGIDTVIASVGALTDTALFDRITEAARSSGARATIAPGAVGGIDLLSALRASGIDVVRYTGRKPPQAWAGSPAEDLLDLNGLTEATPFFQGTAREAARRFPKNANVAATVAFAGLGLDATDATLIADPGAPGNIHEVQVEARDAGFTIRIEGRASANARTSATTALSLLREVRNRQGPVSI